jgi:hypothetical protein
MNSTYRYGWLLACVLALSQVLALPSRAFAPFSRSDAAFNRGWTLERKSLDGGTLIATTCVPLAASTLPVRLTPQGAALSLRLLDGQASLLDMSSVVLWQSAQDWKVTQAAFTDLNRDGDQELSLLLWRAFKPWPVDEFMPHGGRIASFQDSAGQSAHLILIGWKRDRFAELWAGSALAQPLCAFAAADLDGDGKQELAALESQYDDPPGAAARTLTVWEWNGFGFSLLLRAAGTFRQLGVGQTTDGTECIWTR